jgi:hypothetical protein
LAIGCALALYACAGKLDQPQRFSSIVKRLGQGGGQSAGAAGSSAASAPLPACVSKIFSQTCGLAGCHAKGSAQIDLVSTGVAARLVDVKSTSAMCKDKIYVSTSGGQNLLLDKLSTQPPCGARMPLGGMLGTADVQCLAAWVQAIGDTANDAGATP